MSEDYKLTLRNQCIVETFEYGNEKAAIRRVVYDDAEKWRNTIWWEVLEEDDWVALPWKMGEELEEIYEEWKHNTE